jgi:phosphoribosylamine-glycine ligase
MKMTDREKGLLGLFRRLESEKSRDDVIYQAEAMVRAQEALKADYGLVGPDAPLFNGIAAPAGGGKPAA